MMVSGVGTKHYFHQNHLYSVAAMTNSAGAVVERYRYDAYGKRTVTNAAGTPIAASTIGQQRGFTGYQLDAETGLYYARARMYSAGLGRFLGRDPIRADYESPTSGDGYYDGLSLYAAYFAPNGIDPFGLAGDTTHGLERCKPEDCCPVLAAKMAAWIKSFGERYAELLADKFDLKHTDPKAWNNHRDKLIEGKQSILNCLALLILKDCNPKPKWHNVPLPRALPIHETPGSATWKEWWKDYKKEFAEDKVAQGLVIAGGAGLVVAGGIALAPIVLSGGAATTTTAATGTNVIAGNFTASQAAQAAGLTVSVSAGMAEWH